MQTQLQKYEKEHAAIVELNETHLAEKKAAVYAKKKEVFQKKTDVHAPRITVSGTTESEEYKWEPKARVEVAPERNRKKLRQGSKNQKKSLTAAMTLK